MNTNETDMGTEEAPGSVKKDLNNDFMESNKNTPNNDHENIGNFTDGTPEKKEHTRSKMAILFVLGFFAILFLCFIYAMMMGSSLSDLKETLVGVIGALSGILGFIVGYYYKSNEQ